MERRRDVLEDVDRRREVVALLLELGDARAQARQLVSAVQRFRCLRRRGRTWRQRLLHSGRADAR